MAKPVSVETYPLFIEVDKDHKLNYFHNIRKLDWDFGKEKEPIYLWQPNVEPGPNGGKVIEEPTTQRKSKKDFEVQSKRPNPIPNQQDWRLATGNGTTYTLQCDESQKRDYVILTPKSRKFEIYLVGDDFNATKDIPERDADICEHEMEKKISDSLRRRKDISSEYVKELEREANERKESVKNQISTGIIRINEREDDFEDCIDDEMKDYARDEKEDNDIDADLERSDDDVMDDEQEDDEMIDQQELNAMLEKGFLDSELDEEEEDKPEKEKKNVPKPDLPTTEAVKTISEIVEDVAGPRFIKEEEFVRFFLDNGQVLPRDLQKRFHDLIKTDKQKEVFKKLIIKNCKKILRNGIPYFQLRSKKD